MNKIQRLNTLCCINKFLRCIQFLRTATSAQDTTVYTLFSIKQRKNSGIYNTGMHSCCASVRVKLKTYYTHVYQARGQAVVHKAEAKANVHNIIRCPSNHCTAGPRCPQIIGPEQFVIYIVRRCFSDSFAAYRAIDSCVPAFECGSCMWTFPFSAPTHHTHT